MLRSSSADVSSGDHSGNASYSSPLSLQPAQGKSHMVGECLGAIERVTAALIQRLNSPEPLRLPTPELLSDALEGMLMNCAWASPLMIHGFEVTAINLHKGLQLKIRPDTASDLLLDYRVQRQGQQEGIFGVVPGTNKKFLLWGQLQTPYGTVMGSFRYSLSPSAHVELLTSSGQAYFEPHQTARYRKAIGLPS